MKWRRGKRDDERTVELIATVSHEIRSPLTTIKGFTRTLIDRWDRLADETKLDMLRAMDADADRVTRILNELLDVSRIEAGILNLHRRPLELRELSSEVIETLGKRSERHVVELAPGSETEVFGDPDKLRQVLTNFIENAQKYTDTGAITVTCIAEGDEGGMVRVSDQGDGIPADDIPHLFEKFARRDSPGSPTGTGLGLYICKGLVEAHGGAIGAESSMGVGSTFWFRIPKRAPDLT
jgi:signal transduction histidine kinase